jgi:hypothetical protein
MAEQRCLYCEAELVDKRPDALYCDAICGRAYRDANVHMSREAQEFWEAVTRACRPVGGPLSMGRGA